MKNTVQLFLVGLVMFLVSCAPEGESLFGDRREELNSLTVDTTPYDVELHLSPDTTKFMTPFDKSILEEQIEISGNCHASTFKNHGIIVTRENGTAVPILDTLNTSSPNGQAFCLNGRFSIAVDIRSFTAGQVTIVVVALQAEHEGKIYVNDSGARQVIQIVRNN